MDQRHAEYVEYYRVRMKKYENNPMYSHSYQSEKALYEAISTAADLEEFKAKIEADRLPLKNAAALVRDQETARLRLFEEIKEPIKAKECRDILACLDKAEDVGDLITRVNAIRQESSLAQSVDGFTEQFYGDFPVLENIEVRERADVPGRWKKEAAEAIREDLASGQEVYRETTLPRAREWKPDWNLDHGLVWEDRHRRLIPVTDETVKRRIEQHKKYLGV